MISQTYRKHAAMHEDLRRHELEINYRSRREKIEYLGRLDVLQLEGQREALIEHRASLLAGDAPTAELPTIGLADEVTEFTPTSGGGSSGDGFVDSSGTRLPRQGAMYDSPVDR
jgi:hypothetical protein